MIHCTSIDKQLYSNQYRNGVDKQNPDLTLNLICDFELEARLMNSILYMGLCQGMIHKVLLIYLK